MRKIHKLLGQLFIIGFPGAEPSSAFLNFIAEENIGGVILFADNCPSHKIIKENIRKIKQVSELKHPFIAIDQEGGRVSRISGAPAEIAAAKEYGEKYGLERFEDDYARSLYFMESIGINMNLAPVCDLFINENNECLDGRCYGKTIENAIPFVCRSVELAKKYQIISCLKHFPGLGDCAIDPHKETAVGYFDRILWEQRECKVFEAGIASGADMIMTTHIKLPRIDKTIATGSTVIVQNYLRNQLGFDGPIITDDLNMKGAEELGDIGERTLAAFHAGHDLFIFGQNIDASMEAYESFHSAFIRGEITEQRLQLSLERIAGLKFKIARSVLF